MSIVVCPGLTFRTILAWLEKFCLRAARLASLTTRVTYLPPLYRSESQLFGKQVPERIFSMTHRSRYLHFAHSIC